MRTTVLHKQIEQQYLCTNSSDDIHGMFQLVHSSSEFHSTHRTTVSVKQYCLSIVHISIYICQIKTTQNIVRVSEH